MSKEEMKMAKKIISLILALALSTAILPAALAADGEILVSESFENYPTNESSFGQMSVKMTAGVDRRVICEEGSKNKALYANARDTSVKAVCAFSGAEEKNELTFSAKIKLAGARSEGKLFALSGGGSSLTLLNLQSDGSLTLANGKKIGILSDESWTQITISINKKSQLCSVYLGKATAAEKVYLPGGSYDQLNELSWVISEPDEGACEVYLDEVRVYTGHAMPWEMKFPQTEYSNEVLDFVPQESESSTLQIFKSLNFDSGKTTELDEIRKDAAEIAPTTLEGSGAISVKAKKKTGTFFDIKLDSLADIDKYIISMDLQVNELSGDAYLAFFDGKNDGWRVTGRIMAGGAVTLASALGRYASAGASIPMKKRCELAVAYDNAQGVYSFYLDGELIKTIDSSAFKVRPTTIRMLDCQIASSGKIDLAFDNMRIYKAKAPVPREEFDGGGKSDDPSGEKKSIADQSAEAVKAIGGSTVLMLEANSYFADGKKQEYADGEMPKVINGSTVISKDFAEKLYPALAQKATGLDTVEKDGRAYLPLRSLAEGVLGKFVQYDERGFIIISDRDEGLTDSNRVLDTNEPSDMIYRYMQFENPTGEQILADLAKHSPNKTHPRLMMTMADVDYIYEKRDTTNDWKNAYASYISEADSYENGFQLTATANQSSATDFSKVMEILSTAYLLTGDEKYARKAVLLMDTAVSWENLGETTSQLTSGHWAAGMAYGMDGFYSYLNKTDAGRKKYTYYKQRIKALAFDKVIDAYQNGSSVIKWPTMTDNFAGVIAGGMMLLTLALADEEDLRTECEYLAEGLYKTMTITLSIYAPDGAWYEGVSYGDYCIRHLSQAMLSLNNSCGSIYGLLSFKGADKLQDWFTFTATSHSAFNFHDMSIILQRSIYKFGTFYTSYLTGNIEAMAATKRWWALGPGTLPLYALMLYDRSVTDKEIKVDLSGLPLDHYFRRAEAGTFYSSLTSKTPAFVGLHGGETGLPHDMLDVGEFIFSANGEIWAYDLGSDNYNIKQYFNIPLGYRLYRKNAQGENVVVINPTRDSSYYGQEVGARANLLFFDSKPRAAKAAYDLKPIYDRDVTSYVRGYYFGDDRNTLTVRDEIVLKAQSEVYWQMHTTADIEIVDNHTAILTSNGKKCEVSIWSSSDGYTVEDMKCELLPGSPGLDDSDGAKSNDAFRKLAVHFPKAAAGKLDIVVKLSPVADNYNKTPIDTGTRIADWTLPDGEIPKPLLLDGIYTDGKLLDDFDPEKQEYDIMLPFGQEILPEITAKAADGIEINIKNSGEFTQPVSIVLSKQGFADNVYTLKFKVNSDRRIKVSEAVVSDANPVVGVPGELVTAKMASASSIPEDANGPDKMIDGDFSTRCAVEYNCWMEIDLGEITDFAGVAIAFMDGSKRQAIYDILYSEDGVNYQRVFSGRSTGETEEYESISIPGRARYIRFAGYGNTTSGWNSVTEFGVYK